MPGPAQVEKAYLQKIQMVSGGPAQPIDERVDVQFNPESLKLAFSNQIKGEDNTGGAAIQFAGRGTTKLSFEMWFDVSAAQPADTPVDDVRDLTKEVVAFMQTEEEGSGENAQFIPPGCRFQWGSFLFDGVMESANVNLDLFSANGKPLRASVSVSLAKQDVTVQFVQAAGTGAGTAGRQAGQEIRSGESVQDAFARNGRAEGWQEPANAADIDDPQRPEPGTFLTAN